MTMTKEYKGMTFECAKGKAKWTIFTELCKGCGLCIVKCPMNAKGGECLKWSKEVGLYATPAVEPSSETCSGCGICENVCPDSAIRIDR